MIIEVPPSTSESSSGWRSEARMLESLIAWFLFSPAVGFVLGLLTATRFRVWISFSRDLGFMSEVWMTTHREQLR